MEEVVAEYFFLFFCLNLKLSGEFFVLRGKIRGVIYLHLGQINAGS